MLQSGHQAQEKVHTDKYCIFQKTIFAVFNTHRMAGLAGKEYRILREQ